MAGTENAGADPEVAEVVLRPNLLASIIPIVVCGVGVGPGWWLSPDPFINILGPTVFLGLIAVRLPFVRVRLRETDALVHNFFRTHRIPRRATPDLTVSKWQCGLRLMTVGASPFVALNIHAISFATRGHRQRLADQFEAWFNPVPRHGALGRPDPTSAVSHTD